MIQSEKLIGKPATVVPSWRSGSFLSRSILGVRNRLLGPRAPPGSALEAGEPESGGTSYPLRISIRVLVLVIVAALIAPAVAFVSHTLRQHEKEHLHRVEGEGEKLAREIAHRLEQEFAASQTMLSVFGSSGWLEAGELQLLHRRARRALAASGRHLIVLDEDLNQLLNTRTEFGDALPKSADPDAASQVLESGLPTVSNLFFGRVAAALVFNVMRPVTLPDGQRLLLILTRDAANLVTTLGNGPETGPWSYAVLDGRGQVVSRALQPDTTDRGVPASCQGVGGTFLPVRVSDGDGHAFLKAVDGSQWNVCVWADAERLLDSGVLRSGPLYSAAVIWISLALALAVLLSATVSGAISRTARLAEAIRQGRKPEGSRSIIAEIDDVRRSLAEAGAERLRNEERLELLMREMIHRAKNQIALTSSIIRMCSKTASSASELEEDVTGRLLALGRSIDLVTGKGTGSVALSELVRVQLGPFLDSREDRVDVRGVQILLSEAAAASLSLVLHELATNSSKYGAWSRTEGKVAVSWRETDGRMFLVWSEFGEVSRSPDRPGFGTTLIDTLVERSLHGTIRRRFSAGEFRCRIVLPIEAISRTEE